MKLRWQGTLFAIILLTVFVITLGAQNPQNDHEAERQHRLAVIDAVKDRMGLHRAAKLNGGLYRFGKAWLGHIRFKTLEALAQNADTAIIGTPVSSEVKLINDGRSIVTAYKEKVLEAIQGKVQWDEVLRVHLLGGKMVFDDGTTAEIDVVDLPRLQIDHRYLLYLEDIKEPKTYQPLLGPEGIFELGTDGKVLPFATPDDTEAATKGDDVLPFIDKVRFASRLQKAQ